MQQIYVKELIGKNAITLDDGEIVFHEIHDLLCRGETVQLDFDGVVVFGSPFFNAGVGRLLNDLKPDVLNTQLKFEHLSDFGSRVLRRVIENAKEYYAASPEQRRSIDRIVEDVATVM